MRICLIIPHDLTGCGAETRWRCLGHLVLLGPLALCHRGMAKRRGGGLQEVLPGDLAIQLWCGFCMFSLFLVNNLLSNCSLIDTIWLNVLSYVWFICIVPSFNWDDQNIYQTNYQLDVADDVTEAIMMETGYAIPALCFFVACDRCHDWFYQLHGVFKINPCFWNVLSE